MKKNLILAVFPVVLLAILIIFIPQFFNNSVHAEKSAYFYAKTNSLQDQTKAEPLEPKQSATVKQLISYAMSLQGTPYVYAGISPDGFDCSGFTTHVFDVYGIDIPHSSKMQSNEGMEVTRNESQPGDLIIFTGTNAEVREPGHVGIIISEPGDTIAFVHASSNGGVKISKVEGTRYDLRFLEIRRVL